MSNGQDREEEDFAALLEEFESQSKGAGQRRRTPREGDQVTGTIVSITAESVFVEIGAKSEAVLSRAEVTSADGELTVAEGDRIDATVIDTAEGSIVLRTHLGRGAAAPGELQQAFEHGLSVEGTVTGQNKGGLEVQVAGQRGFCPMSQLDNRFVEDPSVFVGRRLSFRITRLEAGRGNSLNIVLSRRQLLEEEAAKNAEQTRAKLAEGLVLRGTVTTIKDYGAFVDIGGIEGMLHISELGFGRVEHPSEILSVGQVLEVQVVKVEATGDPKRPEKVGLSLKAMEEDPWIEATKSIIAGETRVGTITRLAPFGAFVELAPNVEGLVHISELGAGRRINHPKEVVAEGQAVEVSVLAVDQERKRIALSMAAVKAAEEASHAKSYRPETPKSLGTFADLFARRQDEK